MVLVAYVPPLPEHNPENKPAGRRTENLRLSVAPMMDVTDRHFRYMLRQLSRRTLLYTEMITTAAILRGDRDRLLAYHPDEHPLALQLGGDEPGDLAACARIAEDLGYDEINLNVGCPSDRVQNGNFGACLMARPEHVADCVAAMRAATRLPVTVKHRIGIDDRESYEDLHGFVSTVRAAGCDAFAVHARIAILAGLSPAENRTVPPLRYQDVYRLKQDFPELLIEINGGITDFDQSDRHLEHVDAVMIGRAARDNPYLFATADARFFDESAPALTRRELIAAMQPYGTDVLGRSARDSRPIQVFRHMLGLFTGRPGSRRWKRFLSERPRGTFAEILDQAMRTVPGSVLDERPEPAVLRTH